MAATFEIILFLKKISFIGKYIPLVRYFGVDFALEKAFCADGWEFRNQTDISQEDVYDPKTINTIESGKIIIIQGNIDGKHNCGIMLNKEKSDIYYVNVWISSKNIPALDRAKGKENEHIYQDMKSYILNTFTENLVVCGIGTETLIKYSDNIDDIISSSHNVCEWIIPT